MLELGKLSANFHKLANVPYISEAPPIFWQRWYSGLITLRSQLTTPIRLLGRRLITLYDALLAGNDLEITPQLTLKRRPGYISYATGLINGTLLNTYSWKTASNGVFQIFDTTVDVEYIPPGATSPTVIFTKPTSGVGNKGYFFGVGNYLFCSGIGFAGGTAGAGALNSGTVITGGGFKWDGPTGTQGITNWGIANIATASTFGPSPTTHGFQAAGTGPPNWTSPTNIQSNVGFSTITVTAANLGTAGSLNGDTFGFAIPATASVTGIQVSFNALAVNPSGSVLRIGTLKNGNLVGPSKLLVLTGSSQSYTLGGSTDLWGGVWAANDINQTQFGIQFSPAAASSSSSITYEVNNLQVTIYTNNGPVVTVLAPAGTFSAVNGYTYVTAYGNSVSGEISNASPISVNTGAFTNKQGVQIALVASSDPQVNQIRVYRTTDSGGGSIFYELPTSPYPNTSANVTDTAADTALQINNIAATNLQNTPPAANLIAMEWFAGRLWGVAGNQLYFSTGPDTLVGLQQSNWNPAYVFTLPNTANRLSALPNGMLVHTLDDIKIVRGTATITFTVNDFVKDIGLWNYNAADTDGSNVYMFTADRQFLVISADGMQEVGPSGISPIADQLQNIDPTQAYVTMYRSGLDAMVFLLDTVNRVMYPYNSREQAWCLPAIFPFNLVTACGSMEIQSGVWKFLIGTGSGTVGQRDLNTFTDLNIPYTPQVVIGSISVADPGMLAKEDALFLELTSAGSVPTVSILPNDAGVTLTNPLVGGSPNPQITGKFISLSVGQNPVTDAPTYAAQAVNYRSLRYYWMAASNLPEAIKHCQILIQWTNEAAANEVLGLGLSGKQTGDVPAAGALPQLQGH